MKNLVTLRIEQNDSLGCRVSHLSSTDFLGGLLLCGPILCVIECLAAFLASIRCQVVHPLSCDSQQYLCCQMSLRGQNHPRLKNHWFKVF